MSASRLRDEGAIQPIDARNAENVGRPVRRHAKQQLPNGKDMLSLLLFALSSLTAAAAAHAHYISELGLQNAAAGQYSHVSATGGLL
eukprot:1552640-Pleurochrysis_carterae.AAC.3